MQTRVAVLIADGFTDSGLSIALDVLRTANALSERVGRPAPFRVEVVSANGGRVRAASGLVLETTRSVNRLKANVLMVPGAWLERPSDVETWLGRADIQRLIRAIASAHARGASVASSCAGAFLLAEAGLLDDREATTTWWLAEQLKRRRPRVKVLAEATLIVGRRVVTAGAVFSQADVALHLVARFAASSLAEQCANVLLLDTHTSQAPYMAAGQLRASDPMVERAERWIRTHLAEEFDMATLAKEVGASPRTLARRLHGALGLSPIALVQRLRVEASVRMLRTTPLSLEEISARVGYSNASTLSRLIRRETKTSAQEFRRRRQRTARGV
jgi:transcriptional regulator GlxA family with amidase domain